jgi:hypothetical protein
MGRAFVDLPQLKSKALLILLELDDLVFQIKDAKMQIFVLILEFFDIGRILFAFS